MATVVVRILKGETMIEKTAQIGAETMVDIDSLPGFARSAALEEAARKALKLKKGTSMMVKVAYT